MAPPLLLARDLRHAYGDREVLSGLSFEIERGEVFGFLGPNGAGKTTTFHVLTGLLKPERGTFALEGIPVALGDRRLRARLGVVFQSASLDLKLTAKENLFLGAALYAVSKKTAAPRIDRLLALAELTDRADEPVSRFSGGMRRKLELARALVHSPEILVLDEPTAGLDESAFQRIWKRLDELRREEGLTVLVTTHRPEEAERCSRLLVLSGGKAVAEGAVETLRRQVSGDVVGLELSPERDLETDARMLTERFQRTPRFNERTLLIELTHGHEWIPRLVEAFPPGALRSVTLRRPSLADVFLKLTGRELERDEAGPGKKAA
ncbi:MAG: ABC transporter ATP-binding protein [Deltaproteobacteria bacterium]